MSGITSKIKLRTALKQKNKFDLSCDHITTSDFMRVAPVYFKPIVPGESWSCNMQTFTRLSPLVNPMYGRCRIVNRAFFVPMRVIMRHWNEFITDVPVDNTFLQVPKIYLREFANALYEMSYSTTSSSYDFKVGSTNYNLSPEGRRVWTILQALGYRFSIGFYVNNATNNDYVSALPLLAYVKIYKDWYKSQQYTSIDEEIPDSLFDVSVLSSTPFINGVSGLLSAISTAVYDQDYFTSAWDRPVSPNDGLVSSNSITDVSFDGTSNQARSQIRNSSTVTTPVIGSNSSTNSTTVYNLSQFALNSLKSLTDYLKRHQLAGGLAMDRMLSRFGMKPSDAALSRTVYLGKDEVNVQIADVMSNSNGEVQIEGLQNSKTIVGDYAGKGVGYSDNGHFKYESNEYGFVIIVSSLLPKVGYVQGMNRNVLHLDRLDFFTPEFDSLGVQAIARKELLSGYNGPGAAEKLTSLTPAVALDGVFGYTSRYAEYKNGSIYDNMTGDFSVPHLNADSTVGSVNSAWHLNRLIDPSTATVYKLSHNLGFVTASDAHQYDRVFAIPGYDSQAQGVEYDHFINIYHFNVVSYMPMSPMFDDYQFDGGNRDITVDVGGTQLN